MNKQGQARLLIAAFSCVALLLPTFASAAEQPLVAKVSNWGTALAFTPVVDFEHLVLTVTGPCAFEYRQVVRPGDEPVFKLDETTIDGIYTYNLAREEKVDEGIIEILRRAREENDAEASKKLCRQGKLPELPLVQAQGFLVQDGKIQFDPESIEDGRSASFASGGSASAGSAGAVTAAGFGAAAGFQTKDQVILDDLIVDGSACIGFDCVNGESFGFDTIRLKENNLRIKFDDTSQGNFPSNDWQLTANASASGGASKFSIEDITGGRTPFTVEARAPSHSLYVDDGGRIGSGTSAPTVDLHVVDGDTATLRLEQNGSSGFAPQTWDVAGNETSFFVRDASNGSTLPFRIRPGSPSQALVIDTDGDVGIGTLTADAALHVKSTAGDAQLLIEENSGTTAQRTLANFENNGELIFRMYDTNNDREMRMINDNNGYVINILTAGGAGSPGQEFVLADNGNLTILGTLTENSDRNAKTDFEDVDGATILSKVVDLPIQGWRYKDDEPAIRHIGPVAQDFHAAFGLNGTDTGIATLDVGGVALAAIQELNTQLEAKNQALEARLAALEAMVASIAGDATQE